MEQTEYKFSEAEKVFFAAHVEELNKRVLAVNTAVALVVSQQSLEGNWLLKPDASGLVKQESQTSCST